jgi:hypothetical protein
MWRTSASSVTGWHTRSASVLVSGTFPAPARTQRHGFGEVRFLHAPLAKPAPTDGRFSKFQGRSRRSWQHLGNELDPSSWDDKDPRNVGEVLAGPIDRAGPDDESPPGGPDAPGVGQPAARVVDEGRDRSGWVAGKREERAHGARHRPLVESVDGGRRSQVAIQSGIGAPMTLVPKVPTEQGLLAATPGAAAVEGPARFGPAGTPRAGPARVHCG